MVGKKVVKTFEKEVAKEKFRNVSPNWSVEKIEENYIECKNVHGGKIVLQESGSERNKHTKMILRITSKNGTTKIRHNSNPINLIVLMCNYMRQNATGG